MTLEHLLIVQLTVSSCIHVCDMFHLPNMQCCVQYSPAHSEDVLQDVREEQRAKRRRLLSAAASARVRRGMIRYLTV